MAEPFERLPDESTVMRLAEPGSGFLPAGRKLPLPDWLRPTRTDADEGAERGRPAGLSVWDTALTTTSQARRLTGKPSALAFAALVSDVREVGMTHELELDAVRDPLLDRQDEPGWDGHSLIEGLARPSGADKRRYKAVRGALVDRFRSVDPGPA